ncbi:hypothetical protein AVEN_28395-1 [Araneus ventricosus]|uniref:Uncharacterized protein n=1 Tax=Araneus ventricosus TaxID=182803 RepID=A0A4Y2VJV2_ARAVE|nr:hypothetical protein AVEN_28395-1 [Araneus ventricosus]
MHMAKLGTIGTDLVILNSGQMTRTAPDLAPSPSSHTTAAEGHLPTAWRSMGAIHGGYSGVSDFEPGALGPETETLSLCRCGRLECLTKKTLKHNNCEIKRKHP